MNKSRVIFRKVVVLMARGPSLGMPMSAWSWRPPTLERIFMNEVIFMVETNVVYKMGMIFRKVVVFMACGLSLGMPTSAWSCWPTALELIIVNEVVFMEEANVVNKMNIIFRKVVVLMACGPALGMPMLAWSWRRAALETII